MTETDKIRDLVLPYCNGNGLDIGCGEGKIKPSAIGIDTRNCEANLVIDAFLLEDIFKSESFDYVYSSHFLEHIFDADKMLDLMTNLLKTGGYLILYLPHKELYTEENPEHLHNFLPEDILVKLERYDLIRSEVRGGNDEYSFLIIARKKC